MIPFTTRLDILEVLKVLLRILFLFFLYIIFHIYIYIYIYIFCRFIWFFETMNFHDAIILIKSVFNEDKNNYYYDML